jgi:hypothetical protein
MTELYVNAAIAIIALAALGIAVWEGIENRRSNREHWDARAVRLLIEAICKVADVSMPFGDVAGVVET